MEQNDKEKTDDHENQKKGLKGNMLLIVIMSCWLLFYVYMGSQGGGG